MDIFFYLIYIIQIRRRRCHLRKILDKILSSLAFVSLDIITR